MSHAIPNTEVAWTCPHCGTVNHDDYIATTMPECENYCTGDTFDWEDLVTPEKLIELNAALALAAVNRR